MSYITRVHARQIFDSRGNPTVEVDVELQCGDKGRAAVPSGASTGANEAVELRDKISTQYMGKGVTKAVQNVNKILAPKLIGLDALNQTEIDRTLIAIDGTETKSKLGANAILGVSMACARAAANCLDLPLYRYLGPYHVNTLPVPMSNIINGGSHADNSIDFQEFLIMPIQAKSFAQAMQMNTEVFHTLKGILKKKGHVTSVGDEGGFAPNLRSNDEAVEIILQAITKAGYNPKSQIMIAVDPAASEFYNKTKKKYEFKWSSKKSYTSEQMVKFYEKWIKQYPIISLEDGLAENDWAGWKILTDALKDKVQIIGDDIFVTNPKFLRRGIKEGIANSILIKLNQIGTLTETFETVELAKTHNYTAVISHRSGETEDSFIAELVVALGTGQIKIGSLSRSDRLAKYNQLLRIEEELGVNAVYAGKNAFYSI